MHYKKTLHSDRSKIERNKKIIDLEILLSIISLKYNKQTIITIIEMHIL